MGRRCATQLHLVLGDLEARCDVLSTAAFQSVERVLSKLLLAHCAVAFDDPALLQLGNLLL